MLPSYIPETLAANILFIGRTILMFKTDPRDHKINIMADLKSDYYKKITSIEKNREFNITILECTINEIKVYVSQVSYYCGTSLLTKLNVANLNFLCSIYSNLLCKMLI